MSKNGPVLVVSYRFPPSETPTAIIIHQLFQHFPEGSCVVASGPEVNRDDNLALDFPVHRMAPQAGAIWSERVYSRLGLLPLPAVRAWLGRLVDKVQPRHIYSHFPDPLFVVATAHVARSKGIPYSVYFDITWKNNPGRQYRQLARWQSYVARGAENCFAITDVLRDEVQGITGVDVQLLPHTITEVPAADASYRHDPSAANVIHLAGSLYPKMNLDAAQRLVRVLPDLPGRPGLDIFGRNNPETLRTQGIMQPGVKVGLVSRHELFDAQRNSRMLYLPASFGQKSADMTRANFPTRAMEYLVSGVPILVHAPGDSQLSLWAREHGWGLVVDDPSDEALRTGASQLLEDEALRETLVNNAYAFARSRDARYWSARLQAALGL